MHNFENKYIKYKIKYFTSKHEFSKIEGGAPKITKPSTLPKQFTPLKIIYT